MVNVLTRKLESLAPLSDKDKRLLDRVTAQSRKVKGRTDLVREGEAPGEVRLILDGFACRYKVTSDGNRQIMAYLVPGDFCPIREPPPSGFGCVANTGRKQAGARGSSRCAGLVQTALRTNAERNCG